jgi:hypothetical protein
MTSQEKLRATLWCWGVAVVLYVLGLIPGLGLLTILAGVVVFAWIAWFIGNKSTDYPPEDCCKK